MTRASGPLVSPLDGRTDDLKKQPQYLILCLMSTWSILDCSVTWPLTSADVEIWSTFKSFFWTCQWIWGNNYEEPNLQSQNIIMHLKRIRIYSFPFSFPRFFLPFCFSAQTIRLTSESAVGSAFHLSDNQCRSQNNECLRSEKSWKTRVILGVICMMTQKSLERRVNRTRSKEI